MPQPMSVRMAKTDTPLPASTMPSATAPQPRTSQRGRPVEEIRTTPIWPPLRRPRAIAHRSSRARGSILSPTERFRLESLATKEPPDQIDCFFVIFRNAIDQPALGLSGLGVARPDAFSELDLEVSPVLMLGERGKDRVALSPGSLPELAFLQRLDARRNGVSRFWVLN